MSKLQVLKESLIATLLILVAAYLLKLIPFFHVANLKKLGAGDFDIYDLEYAGMPRQNTVRDTNVVLVEVGADRQEIADQINIITSHKPKVIGIDAFFEEPKDSVTDMKLLFALSRDSNIVFAERFVLDTTSELIRVPGFFATQIENYKFGFANFLGTPNAVRRTYPPNLTINKRLQKSFTSAIVEIFAPGQYEELKKRNNNLEIIHYRGNLETYTSLTRQELVEYDTSGQLERVLQNKIVLLGFFMKEPPFLVDDMWFTPTNETVMGKSYPDMYGVVIHANILSMIISGQYAAAPSYTAAYIACFLIIFLFYYWMFTGVKKKGHLNHAKVFFIQIILFVGVMLFFLGLYDRFQFKVPLGFIMLSIIVCPELVWLYEKLAIWLHKKFGYKTVYVHKGVH